MTKAYETLFLVMSIQYENAILLSLSIRKGDNSKLQMFYIYTVSRELHNHWTIVNLDNNGDCCFITRNLALRKSEGGMPSNFGRLYCCCCVLGIEGYSFYNAGGSYNARVYSAY